MQLFNEVSQKGQADDTQSQGYSKLVSDAYDNVVAFGKNHMDEIALGTVVIAAAAAVEVIATRGRSALPVIEEAMGTRAVHSTAPTVKAALKIEDLVPVGRIGRGVESHISYPPAGAKDAEAFYHEINHGYPGDNFVRYPLDQSAGALPGGKVPDFGNLAPSRTEASFLNGKDLSWAHTKLGQSMLDEHPFLRDRRLIEEVLGERR